MATIYQDNSIYLNLENIEEILKIIADIISKPSKMILNKIKSNSTTRSKIKYKTNGIHHEKNNVNNKFESINTEICKTMDSIASSLKKNDLFYDEYFDFCEIRDMTKDTLNREPSLIKKTDLEFLLELVENFSDLINYKIKLIGDKEFNEKYKSKYNSYLTNFYKSQTYFYENICDETLDDELFMEYTKIIME